MTKKRIEEKPITMNNSLLPIQMQSDINKMVPKLCTTTVFAIQDNRILLTFTYKDDPQSIPVVIEKILINKSHARQIVEALKNTIDIIDKDNLLD